MKNKNQAGFSLVELMVVVAIIGILASLAIPSIGKYMAKARQSEAKTQLSSLYTAEKAFFAEYTAYDPRFLAIGYSPEGKLRYNVGFLNATFTAGPTNGYNPAVALPATRNTNTYCGTGTGVIGVNACAMLNGATGAIPPVLQASDVPTSSTFTANATAIIHQAGAADSWTMNQNKDLQNPVNGIP
jgi:type IV pilus assembly protein PilA